MSNTPSTVDTTGKKNRKDNKKMTAAHKGRKYTAKMVAGTVIAAMGLSLSPVLDARAQADPMCQDRVTQKLDKTFCT